MTDTKLQLRLNGYSVLPGNSHIGCCREGERYAHERVGILKIELSRDTREARAIVDGIIAAIDEPRSLIGRSRNGSAVMVFRLQMWINTSLVELALRSGEQVAITIGAENLTVELAAFTWQKSRSPLDIPRDSLPPMFPEFMDIAQTVAAAAGALPAKEIERELATEARVNQFREDVKAGRVKLKTEAELADDAQARSDAETVREWQGATVRPDDGGAARSVLAARARHAVRLSRAKESESNVAA
jgi:hypothetical protein